MDARRHAHAARRPATGALIACVAALGGAALTGCAAPEPSRGFHGEDRVLASYSSGTLYSTLPPEIPVHSVIAAAEMALERRGYVITATESTDDAGRVVARPGDSKLLRKITVESRLRQGGTAVSVRTNPGGHEHISRDIFERMLTRLGM